MARIVKVDIPPEYENKNRFEIYHDLDKVATYAHHLKQQVEDLQAEVKLRDAQLQKQRGDILKLKSWIGVQNIKINDLEVQSVIEEVEAEVVETKPQFNYVQTEEFGEVTGSNLLTL